MKRRKMCECLERINFIKKREVLLMSQYNDRKIVDITRFPSPNPNIELKVITYLSNGLRVKGMLAEPIGEGEYDGFLYLRGGIKNVGKVRPARIAQFAAEGFVVFAPY